MKNLSISVNLAGNYVIKKTAEPDSFDSTQYISCSLEELKTIGKMIDDIVGREAKLDLISNLGKEDAPPVADPKFDSFNGNYYF